MSEWRNTQTPQPSQAGRTIDSSYVKLKWNIQGFFDKLKVLKEELDRRLKEIPSEDRKESEKRKETNKIKRWQEHLTDFLRKIEYLKTVKIFELEKILNHKFMTPDLLVLSLIQPSFKKLFNDFKTSSLEKNLKSLTAQDLENFMHMHEAAEVLALIGDAAIDIALVQILWVPNISKVGELTTNRADIVSNKNLGRICDKLDLYDCRIHMGPPAPNITEKTINHTKGTIVEAIFGVIYLERGLEQVVLSSLVLK